MKQKEPPVDMDAVSAYLDRGWELLRKNDLRGAEHSARRAIQGDPEAPEGLTLLGAIRAAEGEPEEALEQYRKALELDPEYVPAMLYAAEILLDAAEEGDEKAGQEALSYLEDALELAEEEDEYLDALLLQVEALLALGREEEARAALAELPPVALPESSFHLRAGRAFLDLGELDEAERHYRKAIELDPKSGDAYHGLGLVLEERGDARGMIEAFLKVRELDLAEKPVPWALSQEKFEEIAEAALAELPPRARQLLENVPIVASDYPSVEVISEGWDPRILGFFSGIPWPEKSNVAGAQPHLDAVFLYKRNIERMSRNEEEVAREIRVTLLHETGHFFGLSDEELEEMGLG